MYTILNTSNQDRKSLTNLSIEEVHTWLLDNKYNLFGWSISIGAEAWPAAYFLRYKTTLPM